MIEPTPLNERIEGRLAPPAKVRPSIGRIVHYHPTDRDRVSFGTKGQQVYAALIAGVFETGDGAGDICSLTVFPPGCAPVPLPSASVRAARTSRAPGRFRRGSEP